MAANQPAAAVHFLSRVPLEVLAASQGALHASRPNHGVQTAYAWGEDIGGMERSRYFGYRYLAFTLLPVVGCMQAERCITGVVVMRSKDLYHFDHFLVSAC